MLEKKTAAGKEKETVAEKEKEDADAESLETKAKNGDQNSSGKKPSTQQIGLPFEQGNE